MTEWVGNHRLKKLNVLIRHSLQSVHIFVLPVIVALRLIHLQQVRIVHFLILFYSPIEKMRLTVYNFISNRVTLHFSSYRVVFFTTVIAVANLGYAAPGANQSWRFSRHVACFGTPFDSFHATFANFFTLFTHFGSFGTPSSARGGCSPPPRYATALLLT